MHNISGISHKDDDDDNKKIKSSIGKISTSQSSIKMIFRNVSPWTHKM